MSAQRHNDPRLAPVSRLRPRRPGGADFCVSVRAHPAGRWTVLEVEGEMDIRAFPLIPDLVGKDAPRVLVELRRVSFMDARGLGAIVEAQRRARSSGGYVRLVAPARCVRRILTLTGCDRRFLTFDTLDQAVAPPLGADPTEEP